MEVPVYFEDLVVGASFLSDEVTIDREEMLAYNRCNDPWPFHVDEASAARNPYGSLIASGGYSITLMYRLGHQIYNVPGRRWAVLGASEWHLKFPAPVRAGDRVRLRITIKGKRESSKPRRGHFDLLYELMDQADKVVLSVVVAGLIERRPIPSSRPERSGMEGPDHSSTKHEQVPPLRLATRGSGRDDGG